MSKAIIAIFIINILYILKKIGVNRRFFCVILNTLLGTLLSVGIVFLFKEEDIFQYVAANCGICLFVTYYITVNLDKVNGKTEDISWKKLFRKGIIIGLNICLLLINIIFLMYYVTEKDTAFIVSASTGISFTALSSTLLYSIFNSKKTIYKTVSDNKLEGQRSLKI